MLILKSVSFTDVHRWRLMNENGTTEGRCFSNAPCAAHSAGVGQYVQHPVYGAAYDIPALKKMPSQKMDPQKPVVPHPTYMAWLEDRLATARSAA